MHRTPEFTHLWLEAPEALFSDAQDYRDALRLLADLCPPARPEAAPLLGYCLLAEQMHLLLAANAAQAGQLADQLMAALAGSAEHPLRRAWQMEAIGRRQLPAALTALHRLPCQLGLVADADLHPWSSHDAFARPARAPAWLATELVWQHWPVRRVGRVRAYQHLLQNPAHPPARRPRPAARQRYSVTERQIADRVLRDHQCNWAQLASARMRRRKRLLAGLSAALARGLGVHGQDRSELPALFGIDAERLMHYEMSASREASQYLVMTASKLISQPGPSSPASTGRPEPLQAARPDAEPIEPITPPADDGHSPLDYLDAERLETGSLETDREPGLHLVL